MNKDNVNAFLDFILFIVLMVLLYEIYTIKEYIVNIQHDAIISCESNQH